MIGKQWTAVDTVSLTAGLKFLGCIHGCWHWGDESRVSHHHRKLRPAGDFQRCCVTKQMLGLWDSYAHFIGTAESAARLRECQIGVNSAATQALVL